MTIMNNEDPADQSVHEQRELPEPAAWVRDLASPQPHCVTSLRYRSKSDADVGTWYAPLYTADQVREAIAAGRGRGAKPPKWWTCKTHGDARSNAWGCPECVRELRDDETASNRSLPGLSGRAKG